MKEAILIYLNSKTNFKMNLEKIKETAYYIFVIIISLFGFVMLLSMIYGLGKGVNMLFG